MRFLSCLRAAVCSSLLIVLAGCATYGATITSAGASGASGPPRRYHAPHVTSPITIDGRPDDPAWSAAPWSEPFVDIRGAGRPSPRYATRMKIAWDDEHLYVAALLEEPHVWATLTERDEIVFHDNDFEVFIDPDGDRREYYEVEVNALETIFDLLLERTYIDGGPARHEWDLAGLRAAVHVDGTLNDPADVDRSWSVELAMPWARLAEHAHRPSPPRAGDVWRINFSRVQWRHVVTGGAYAKVPDQPEDNWVWSPQGVVNMHLPEHWGYVVFVGP